MARCASLRVVTAPDILQEIVHYQKPNLTIVEYDGCLVFIMRSALSGEDVREMARIRREMDRRWASGLVTLTLLEENSALPGLDVQKAAIAELSHMKVAGVAVVTMSQGFLASAVRSIVTSIFRLKKGTWPVVLFDDVPEATAWCATRVKRPATWGFRLGRVIDRCRRYQVKESPHE